MVEQDSLAPSGSGIFCVNHLTGLNHTSPDISLQMRVVQLLVANTDSAPSNLRLKIGVLCDLIVWCSSSREVLPACLCAHVRADLEL